MAAAADLAGQQLFDLADDGAGTQKNQMQQQQQQQQVPTPVNTAEWTQQVPGGGAAAAGTNDDFGESYHEYAAANGGGDGEAVLANNGHGGGGLAEDDDDIYADEHNRLIDGGVTNAPPPAPQPEAEAPSFVQQQLQHLSQYQQPPPPPAPAVAGRQQQQQQHHHQQQTPQDDGLDLCTTELNRLVATKGADHESHLRSYLENKIQEIHRTRAAERAEDQLALQQEREGQTIRFNASDLSTQQPQDPQLRPGQGEGDKPVQHRLTRRHSSVAAAYPMETDPLGTTKRRVQTRPVSAQRQRQSVSRLSQPRDRWRYVPDMRTPVSTNSLGRQRPEPSRSAATGDSPVGRFSGGTVVEPLVAEEPTPSVRQNRSRSRDRYSSPSARGSSSSTRAARARSASPRVSAVAIDMWRSDTRYQDHERLRWHRQASPSPGGREDGPDARGSGARSQHDRRRGTPQSRNVSRQAEKERSERTKEVTRNRVSHRVTERQSDTWFQEKMRAAKKVRLQCSAELAQKHRKQSTAATPRLSQRTVQLAALVRERTGERDMNIHDRLAASPTVAQRHSMSPAVRQAAAMSADIDTGRLAPAAAAARGGGSRQQQQQQHRACAGLGIAETRERDRARLSARWSEVEEQFTFQPQLSHRTQVLASRRRSRSASPAPPHHHHRHTHQHQVGDGDEGATTTEDAEVETQAEGDEAEGQERGRARRRTPSPATLRDEQLAARLPEHMRGRGLRGVGSRDPSGERTSRRGRSRSPSARSDSSVLSASSSVQSVSSLQNLTNPPRRKSRSMIMMENERRRTFTYRPRTNESRKARSRVKVALIRNAQQQKRLDAMQSQEETNDDASSSGAAAGASTRSTPALDRATAKALASSSRRRSRSASPGRKSFEERMERSVAVYHHKCELARDWPAPGPGHYSPSVRSSSPKPRERTTLNVMDGRP